MKFWKILSNLIEETLPDWRDKFLSYKDLKKQLKLIYPKDGDNPTDCKRPRLENMIDTSAATAEKRSRWENEGEMTKEVNDFLKLLEEEIEKFNGFFGEKEEDYVIKWKELQDRVTEAKYSDEELILRGREIVDFHGEMVLLENYSALNYTGLVKIIKKYDKRSGDLARLPFIQKVLQQPFYGTDLLNKLIKECEMMLDDIFPKGCRSSSPPNSLDKKEGCSSASMINSTDKVLEVPEELSEIEHMESLYVKLTSSALRTLKEIRGGSSTISMFSLPPFNNSTMELEGSWKNLHPVEQAAK